ncbi:transcriptional regulator [Aliivibrio wodanis]|uniref:Transcriptional regulator n=1 Tax=Aliivibrio wodanis TaxID=80852 RepID=A0A090I757_9GAMM|nr:transcriptional regulator [Aliivibrio wodanis]
MSLVIGYAVDEEESSLSFYGKDGKHDCAKLSKSELKLLVFFMQNSNKLVSVDVLMQVGWDGRIVGDNSLNVSISSLRKKLKHDNLIKIVNIPKKGYKFSYNEDSFYNVNSRIEEGAKANEGLSLEEDIKANEAVSVEEDIKANEAVSVEEGIKVKEVAKVKDGKRLEIKGVMKLIYNKSYPIIFLFSIGLYIYFFSNFTYVDCFEIKGSYECNVNNFRQISYDAIYMYNKGK